MIERIQVYFNAMNHTKSRTASWIRRLIFLLLVLLVAGAGIYVWGPRKKSMAATIPNAEVKLGEFIDYVELRGEIAVRSSKVITAPYNAGDLQILKLVQNGANIKKGDLVVEFDPTTVKRNADQYRAALNQVEAEIARTNAQRLLSDEQNKTEVMSAQFGLERAQLDASTRDVVPAIEHEKNVLALAKAEQKLRELDTKLASSRVGSRGGSCRGSSKARQSQRGSGAGGTKPGRTHADVSGRRNYYAAAELARAHKHYSAAQLPLSKKATVHGRAPPSPSCPICPPSMRPLPSMKPIAAASNWDNR